ncbi:MAG: FKBP-type peptidyl-prolyl cis-trans isomerase [Bacteroidota bacterium]|nr:FKBP-type peptidyl-prolyl cis-trans isomerase [Bacteroidota bacterium]
MKRIFQFKSPCLQALIGVLFFCSLFSCSKEEEEPEEDVRKRQDMAAIQDYLATNQVEATQKPFSIYEYYYYKLYENPNEKTPTDGNIVLFYYKMYLLDGTEIASYTAADGDPIPAKYGSTTIFPYTIGHAFQHLKKGETQRLLLPSYLAFHTYTNEDIPQYSNIVVDIELVDILTVDQQKQRESAIIDDYIEENELGTFNKFSSGLRYKVLEAGTGSTPVRGNRISVAYKGTLLDGTVFDESKDGSPLVYNLGSTSMIAGWEQGVPLMQNGEKAMLLMPSHLAYSNNITVIPESIREDLVGRSLPPFSILKFELTLEDIK